MKSVVVRLLGLVCLSIFITLPSAPAAFAVELGRIEGFGPVARGMAGAGVAHKTGAAAMILNPAELMSLDQGHEFMIQVSEIHANIDVRNLQTHQRARNSHLGENRGPYDLPEIAYSFRGNNWAGAIGIFAAAGFGIEYRDRSFLSTTTTGNVDTGLRVSSRLSALRIPFALAWQPNQTIRLGAAIDIVNLGINLATLYDARQIRMLVNADRANGGLVDIVNALPTLAGVHLEFVNDHPVNAGLSSWGLGGRVGVTWIATPRTSLGLAYEFETQLPDLKGNGRLTAIDILNTQIGINGQGKFEDMQLPASFTLGVSHQFSDTLSLVADVRRTFWKRMLGDARFAYRAQGGLFDGQSLQADLPLGFNNLTTLALGMEWSPSDQWTFRAGAAHALQQLVKDQSLNGAVPTITQNHLTANASYQWQKKHELSFGATYAWTRPIRNPGNNIGSIPEIEANNRQVTPVISYRLNL